jgi:hypothetical protein
MRLAPALFALAAALPAPAGDTQAGTTVTWELRSELTGETGEKTYG